MTRRVGVEQHRIELLVARAMLNKDGVVRRLSPEQVVMLMTRELAKRDARVRRIVNKQTRFRRGIGSMWERTEGEWISIVDLLAALSGRKGTR